MSLELNVRVWGFPFKNPGALEPKAWYVRTTRAVGVGMIAAGLAGLVLESQAGTDEEESEGADESDDPIEVTVG